MWSDRRMTFFASGDIHLIFNSVSIIHFVKLAMVATCDKCSYVGKYKFQVKNHQQRIHSELKPWRCEFPGCSLRFKCKYYLNSHKRKHETDPETRKPHRCKFSKCEYRAAVKGTLKNHIEAKHTPSKPRNVSCPLCPKLFNSGGALKSHVQTHVRELRLSCTHCNFSTHSQGSLRIHVKTVHEKPMTYFCKFQNCKYSTKNFGTWKSHGRTHDPDPKVRRPLPCNFPNCKFRASCRANVRQHILARHNPERTMDFMCSLCSKAFYTSAGLKSHVNSCHTNETVYSCSQCSYASYSSKSLRYHTQKKHRAGDSCSKNLVCELCGYRANQKYLMDSHKMNLHSTERKFECEQPGCTYRTNSKSALKLHGLVHEDDLRSRFPFACTISGCDFRRKSKWEILLHEKLHVTCKTRLKCNLCSNSCYPDQKSLQFHRFKYHDTKCWKCQMCDYAASQNQSLQKHIQKNHDDSAEIKPSLAKESKNWTGTVGKSGVGSRFWCHPLEDRIPVVILEKIEILMR